MIKYKAGHYGKEKILAVDVERETDKCVWIEGRKCSKQSDYENYFDTWDDAKSFLLDKAERKVISERRALELAIAEFGNIKGLKKIEAPK